MYWLGRFWILVDKLGPKFSVFFLRKRNRKFQIMYRFRYKHCRLFQHTNQLCLAKCVYLSCKLFFQQLFPCFYFLKSCLGVACPSVVYFGLNLIIELPSIKPIKGAGPTWTEKVYSCKWQPYQDFANDFQVLAEQVKIQASKENICGSGIGALFL